MRISLANLLLLGAVVAAPAQELDRSKEVDHGNFVARGLFPISPRIIVKPVRPVTPVRPAPVRPVEPPAPVRPGTEPVRPPTSPDGPLRNPNEPDGPGTLKPETPAKPPAQVRPGPTCGRKRGPCLEGAKVELGIDANYKREVTPAKAPDAQYLKTAGIESPESNWFQSTIDNGPDARKKFEETVVPYYKKTYDPANNPNSKFEDWQFDYFLQNERIQFGKAGGHDQPFIQTQNNHGKHPTMTVEQMFKERDLYNGCEKCTMEAFEVDFTRPAVPRDGAKKVFTSEELADNWRVSAAQAGVEPQKIDNFAMNNIATPDSKKVFEKDLFKDVNEGTVDKTFAAGTPEFDKIEATVQGQIIKRMLDTEKDTFGNKVITEHRVFKDGSTWHMVNKTKEV